MNTTMSMTPQTIALKTRLQTTWESGDYDMFCEVSREGARSSSSNPFDDAVREQLQDRVASAVAELPSRIRLPLVLAEIAEVPLEDVAQVLGLKLVDRTH